MVSQSGHFIKTDLFQAGIANVVVAEKLGQLR